MKIRDIAGFLGCALLFWLPTFVVFAVVFGLWTKSEVAHFLTFTLWGF